MSSLFCTEIIRPMFDLYWNLLHTRCELPFHLLINLRRYVIMHFSIEMSSPGLGSLGEFDQWSEKIDSCRLPALIECVNEFFLSFCPLFISILIITYSFYRTLSKVGGMRLCVYVSPSINISRCTTERIHTSVKVSLDTFTHISRKGDRGEKETVEGVCSRLIVDYHHGTCEWMVNFICFFVSSSLEKNGKRREERRREKENEREKGEKEKRLICKRITCTSQAHFWI